MKQRYYKQVNKKSNGYIDSDAINRYHIVRNFNTEQCKQKLNSVYGVMMNNAKK